MAVRLIVGCAWIGTAAVMRTAPAATHNERAQDMYTSSNMVLFRRIAQSGRTAGKFIAHLPCTQCATPAAGRGRVTVETSPALVPLPRTRRDGAESIYVGKACILREAASRRQRTG